MPMVIEADPTQVADFENDGNPLCGAAGRVLGGVADADTGARRSGGCA